jgi:signal peptidase I
MGSAEVGEAKLETKHSGSGGLAELLRIVVHALILVFIVRTFFFQSFNIPSGSMIPTLLVGDYLFASKYPYGYSKYSLPLSPNLFSGRIWSGTPKQGDVIVFRLPRDPTQDYIKRLIGLPGDKIQMKAGVLHINDKPVALKQIDDFVGSGSTCNLRKPEIRVARYVETLPNGVVHEILDCGPTAADNTPPYVVPADHYFMMGDNRDNSIDSRFAPEEDGVGYVPAENLVGRADFRFFSVEESGSLLAPWRWPWEFRWSRFFNVIR